MTSWISQIVVSCNLDTTKLKYNYLKSASDCNHETQFLNNNPTNFPNYFKISNKINTTKLNYSHLQLGKFRQQKKMNKITLELGCFFLQQYYEDLVANNQEMLLVSWVTLPDSGYLDPRYSN